MHQPLLWVLFANYVASLRTIFMHFRSNWLLTLVIFDINWGLVKASLILWTKCFLKISCALDSFASEVSEVGAWQFYDSILVLFFLLIFGLAWFHPLESQHVSSHCCGFSLGFLLNLLVICENVSLKINLLRTFTMHTLQNILLLKRSVSKWLCLCISFSKQINLWYIVDFHFDLTILLIFIIFFFFIPRFTFTLSWPLMIGCLWWGMAVFLFFYWTVACEVFIDMWPSITYFNIIERLQPFNWLGGATHLPFILLFSFSLNFLNFFNFLNSLRLHLNNLRFLETLWTL